METKENPTGWNSLPLSTKIKYISIVVLAVLFTIFITQNMDKVTLKVFFWSLDVPFIFALILCFFMGAIITYIWMKISASRRKGKEKKDIDSRTD